MNFFAFIAPEVGTDKSETWYLPSDNTKYQEGPSCESCGLFLGPNRRMKPYEIEIKAFGKQLGDFVSFTGSTPDVVSEKFLQAYQGSGLSGINVLGEVEVVKITPKKFRIGMPKYFYIEYFQSKAVLDDKASGVIRMGDAGVCPVCLRGDGFKRQNKIIFKKDTWSGEDIFNARGVPATIVTERFKTFCELNRFTNCVFIPSEEYAIDLYPWENKPIITSVDASNRLS